MANYYYGKIVFYGQNILEEMSSKKSLWLNHTDCIYEDKHAIITEMRILFPFNTADIGYRNYDQSVADYITLFLDANIADDTKALITAMTGVGIKFQLEEESYNNTPVSDFPVVVAFQSRSRIFGEDTLLAQFEMLDGLEKLEIYAICDIDGCIEKTIYTKDTCGEIEVTNYASYIEVDSEEFSDAEYIVDTMF